MKILFIVFVLISAQIVNAFELKLSSSDQTVLVNSSQYSCLQLKNGEAHENEIAAVQGPSFNINNLSVDWSGIGIITVTKILVEFVSDNLEVNNYTCIISGDEILSILPAVIYTDTKVDATCDLRCGNLKLKPGLKQSNIQGKISFYGNQISAYGINEIMVSAPIALNLIPPPLRWKAMR